MMSEPPQPSAQVDDIVTWYARREVVVGEIEALELAQQNDLFRNPCDAVVAKVEHRHVLQTLQMLDTDRLQVVVAEVKLLCDEFIPYKYN